jgi:hypothetical protein
MSTPTPSNSGPGGSTSDWKPIWVGTVAVVWFLISTLMLLMIVSGLICVVIALLSLVVDMPVQLYIGRAQMQAPAEKLLFAGVGAGMAVIGGVFWWLRQRGYVRGAFLVYVAVIVFVSVMTWGRGSDSLFSITIGAN